MECSNSFLLSRPCAWSLSSFRDIPEGRQWLSNLLSLSGIGSGQNLHWEIIIRDLCCRAMQGLGSQVEGEGGSSISSQNLIIFLLSHLTLFYLSPFIFLPYPLFVLLLFLLLFHLPHPISTPSLSLSLCGNCSSLTLKVIA